MGPRPRSSPRSNRPAPPPGRAAPATDTNPSPLGDARRTWVNAPCRLLLQQAVAANNVERVALLIAGGGRDGAVDAIDANGWTALHYAVEGKRLGMVATLLFAGADKEKKDFFGRTPYILAASLGCEEVLWALVDANCARGVVCNKGWTALHHATERGRIKNLRFLLDIGEVGVNERSLVAHGATTALFHANRAAVKLLLANGANMEVLAHGGVTWEQYTRRQGGVGVEGFITKTLALFKTEEIRR
jgi:ankyrin repeat protein